MVEILSSNGGDRKKARLAQNLASPNPLRRHSPHQASPSVAAAAASSRLSPGEEQSERVRENERKREKPRRKRRKEKKNYYIEQ
jgi:hypothetical protein